MEASHTELTSFISREKLERLGFDPILAEAAAEHTTDTKPVYPDQQNRYLPRPPKTIPLPPEVIDPCPPQARLRTGSFMHRHSGEY